MKNYEELLTTRYFEGYNEKNFRFPVKEFLDIPFLFVEYVYDFTIGAKDLYGMNLLKDGRKTMENIVFKKYSDFKKIQLEFPERNSNPIFYVTPNKYGMVNLEKLRKRNQGKGKKWIICPFCFESFVKSEKILFDHLYRNCKKNYIRKICMKCFNFHGSNVDFYYVPYLRNQREKQCFFLDYKIPEFISNLKIES